MTTETKLTDEQLLALERASVDPDPWGAFGEAIVRAALPSLLSEVRASRAALAEIRDWLGPMVPDERIDYLLRAASPFPGSAAREDGAPDPWPLAKVQAMLAESRAPAPGSALAPPGDAEFEAIIEKVIGAAVDSGTCPKGPDSECAYKHVADLNEGLSALRALIASLRAKTSPPAPAPGAAPATPTNSSNEEGA